MNLSICVFSKIILRRNNLEWRGRPIRFAREARVRPAPAGVGRSFSSDCRADFDSGPRDRRYALAALAGEPRSETRSNGPIRRRPSSICRRENCTASVAVAISLRRSGLCGYDTILVNGHEGEFDLPQNISGEGVASLTTPDDGGHDMRALFIAFLAVGVCSALAAAQTQPASSPPAAETIRAFLTTTHRNLGSPAGMPNPELVDFQTRQVVAYLLSLRNPSAAALGRKPAAAQERSCRAEITRLEVVLSQARASGKAVGSAPESSAARLHHQPTIQSAEQAAREAEKTVETALALARKLEAEGLDAECAAMLKKVEPPAGSR